VCVKNKIMNIKFCVEAIKLKPIRSTAMLKFLEQSREQGRKMKIRLMSIIQTTNTVSDISPIKSYRVNITSCHKFLLVSYFLCILRIFTSVCH